MSRNDAGYPLVLTVHRNSYKNGLSGDWIYLNDADDFMMYAVKKKEVRYSKEPRGWANRKWENKKIRCGKNMKQPYFTL